MYEDKQYGTKLVQHGQGGVRPFAVRSWKQLTWRGKDVAGSVSARYVCNTPYTQFSTYQEGTCLDANNFDLYQLNPVFCTLYIYIRLRIALPVHAVCWSDTRSTTLHTELSTYLTTACVHYKIVILITYVLCIS